jgi:S-adenosylmethionine:tRNA ribosyltransferase-isomerase
MSIRTDDYQFTLDDELIARYPAERRDASRMMVLDRAAGTIRHERFADFPNDIREGDLLVLNDTRVIPARVFTDDRSVELLVVEQAEGRWRCMVKPGRKARAGAVLAVAGCLGSVASIEADGTRVIDFGEHPPDLAACGEVPLPPYLGRSPEPEDATRYQTVYATVPGAIAAPTAGLHFTPELLAALPHRFVTLHVGAGTFRPVQTGSVLEHDMHAERYLIGPETADAVAAAKRVVAVGTTSVRTLETAARLSPDGTVRPHAGATQLFIYPPFEFRVVGAMLTNFHLPRSTLLMLICAFAGREFVLEAYRAAVAERYRFYSYGDCMLIV